MSNNAKYKEATEKLRWLITEFMFDYGWTVPEIQDYLKSYGYSAARYQLRKINDETTQGEVWQGSAGRDK